jgi:hypothetical protein
MNSKETSIPERCRKCPVLARYIFVISELERIERIQVRKALNKIDNSRSAYPKKAKRLQEKSQQNAELSLQTYDALQSYRDSKNQIVSRMTGVCPGPRLGTTTTGVDKLFDIAMGQRICRNPDFTDLSVDSTFARELKLGHWALFPIKEDRDQA